jgi:regulator of replication initiation timing
MPIAMATSSSVRPRAAGAGRWWGRSTMSDLEPRLEDLEARFEALNRGRLYLSEEVDRLQEENEKLQERVSSLEEIVSPDPGAVGYEQLTREQKVFRVRRALVEEAAQSRGAASMNYKDVKWLFDGNPSNGHVYDLMKLAAELDGFDYQTDPAHRIVVNLGDVNDDALFHAANKARGGESA